MILTKRELDNMAAEKADDCVHFESPCHRHAGVAVTYYDGVITIECGECPDVLAEIRVG